MSYYYTKYWEVRNSGDIVNLIFLTKKEALAWISQQPAPEFYTVKKISME